MGSGIIKYNIERFIEPSNSDYETALKEVKNNIYSK